MDTSNVILACPSNQLQVAHRSRPLATTDKPLSCATKALWCIATKFPMLGSTSFTRSDCRSCACSGDGLLYRDWWNRARWRWRSNGWPSVAVWPLLFSGVRKALERHPEDTVSEEETDTTEVDAVYLLLRQFAVEKIVSYQRTAGSVSLR